MSLPLIPVTDGELPDWWTIEVDDLAGTGLSALVDVVLHSPPVLYCWMLGEPPLYGGVASGQAADVNDAVTAMNRAAVEWRADQDERDADAAMVEVGAKRRRP